MSRPKKNQEIILPEGGLESHTWYLVEVSFSAGNPRHKALFYTGFLNGYKNMPGGYSGFQALNSAHDEDRLNLYDCVYCKFIKPVIDEKGNTK